MISIPAITLWNPWASWVKRRLKMVETRTHNRLAGLSGRWIAIHAGRFWHQEAFTIAAPYLSEDALFNSNEYKCECGCIVALAHVLGAGSLSAVHSKAALCDCSAGDLFGLVFDRVEPLAKPVAASGGRGIWQWQPADADVQSEIQTIVGER